MDTQTAASLLDEFEELPGRISRPQTFMEIGGYPHYENVCSNFLAFFFGPQDSHGLGSLFLDALVGSVGIADGEGGLGGDVTVEREVVTEAGNRIDLLITSDSHAVLIENKIFAAVANPFEDYAAYLRSLKNRNGDPYRDENKVKVLLTLYPSGEGAEWGFCNLTHAGFASAVRCRLGHHIYEADTHYLTLMIDFLNTLEHLGEGTRMNQEFVKLLGDRGDEVEAFLRGTAEVRGEARRKARALEDRIDLAKIKESIHLQDYQDVRLLPWQPNPNHRLTHYLQYRVYIDVGEESYVVVEPFVSPSGWQIQVFYRVDRASQNRLELQKLLEEIGIRPEGNPFVHPKDFPYDKEDLSDLATVVEEELRRVAAIVQDIGDKAS